MTIHFYTSFFLLSISIYFHHNYLIKRYVEPKDRHSQYTLASGPLEWLLSIVPMSVVVIGMI